MGNKAISRIVDSLVEWKNRDKYILSQFGRAIESNKVNVHYHDCNGHNIGDALSPIVCRNCAQLFGVDFDKRIPQTKHLYAVGSILFFGYQNCTVWGSGFLNKPDRESVMLHRLLSTRMDIRAVRGPKTREVLISNGWKCPEIYGDPAIMMPLFYIPKTKKNKRLYCGTTYVFQW